VAVTLRTPAAVIAALGGTREAADRLGTKLPRISMWLARGRIPSDLFITVNKALRPAGKAAAPEVFGMAVPAKGVTRVARARRAATSASIR
jgi:hypothetical protein